MRSKLSLILAGALAAALSGAPQTVTHGVVDGQPDTLNNYANVARIEYESEGSWFTGCSGTLVAPTLVLTAAHCVAGSALDVIPPGLVRVNFNPALSFPSDPADPLASSVVQVIVHPTLESPGVGGGNGKTSLLEPWDDIALLRLGAAVAGISLAPVASAGYLDALDLRSETFTAVGFGVDGFALGSIASPVGTILDDLYRSYVQVTVLGHDAYSDRYLKISAANCFGDSGGPLFHDGVVVAITVWTNSARCEGPGLDYRLDTPIAQELLGANL